MNPAPPVPPPPPPPSPKPVSFMTVLGITAAIVAGMLVFAVIGFFLWSGGPSRPDTAGQTTPAKPEAPRLGTSYRGELNWDGQSVRITWRENGTLDNDNDHLVVLIQGADVELQAVWGWMESVRNRAGVRGEIHPRGLKVPSGWPTPRSVIIDQALPGGGWTGKLDTPKGPIVIRLEP